MADTVTLTYADCPGIARTVRIALCLGGIEVLNMYMCHEYSCCASMQLAFYSIHTIDLTNFLHVL